MIPSIQSLKASSNKLFEWEHYAKMQGHGQGRITSRREGVEIRKGHTVGFGGVGNTLVLNLDCGCNSICFINYLSNRVCVLFTFLYMCDSSQ